jgi:hypothetical protein
MELFDAIPKRRSIRKYAAEEISINTMEQIESYGKSVKRLNENIKTEMDFVSGSAVKLDFNLPITAPYYIVFYSEKKDSYLTNAGFMLQQMDLFLFSIGLGSCWLGVGRPEQKVKNDMEYVIVLAYGIPDVPPRLGFSEFGMSSLYDLSTKRKPISEIMAGQDERIEYARMAPSTSNSQPWYFVCQDGRIEVYIAKRAESENFINRNGVFELIREKVSDEAQKRYSRNNQIDIGIALCHLWIASMNQGKSFTFTFGGEPALESAPSEYAFFGTVL